MPDIPLPIRLQAEDLEPMFQLGQRLTFRERGSRFACEVVAVLEEYKAAIGVWYVVRFEGSEEVKEMPQHVLSLSRAEAEKIRRLSATMPSPATETTTASGTPEKKRLSSTRTPKKEKPSYTQAESPRSSHKSEDFSFVAPRIRRSSLSERPQSIHISPESPDSRSSFDSWLVEDIEESPMPKRVRKASERFVKENGDPSVEKAIIEKPKKIKKNARVEYPVNTGAKFVHRSSTGSIECELIDKRKDHQGCWLYEIEYEGGRTVKNVPAWKIEKADIMSAYRGLETEHSLPANTRDETCEPTHGAWVSSDGHAVSDGTGRVAKAPSTVAYAAERRHVSNIELMDPEECMSCIDAEIGRAFARNWATELSRANLASWLEGAVNWAIEKVTAKDRLAATLRVLGRLGFYFQRNKPGPVLFMHFSEVVAADYDLISSPNVSEAIRAAFGLALSDAAECSPAALRDVLKADIFPKSEGRESRDAWQLAGLLLTLCCKKTVSLRRSQLLAAYLSALPSYFLEDARGKEFVIGLLASVATSQGGLPEYPLVRGKTDVGLLIPAAVDILSCVESERVEGAWRYIALIAGTCKFAELEDMQKLGWFGWSRRDERMQTCNMRGYSHLNFDEARRRKLHDDRTRGVRQEYDEWKEARIHEIPDKKKRRPDAFLVFWKREKEPILIGGTSFFEDKFAIEDEDTYDVWVRRKFWASEIATKIYDTLPDCFPHKAASLMYLAECRRLLTNSMLRESLDIDRSRVTDPSVYQCLRKGVVPALKYILSTIDPRLAAVYASQLL